MNTRRSPRRKPMADINVVPYIDVMLVLLVIFMVTSPLQQNGIEMDLPIAHGKPIDPSTLPSLVIHVKKGTDYYISENGTLPTAVSRDDLVTKTVTLYQDNPSLKVYIRGDKSVAYGRVVSIMAALKQSGIAQIGLMTTPEE